MVLHIVYSDKIAVLQLTTVDDLPPAMSHPTQTLNSATVLKKFA